MTRPPSDHPSKKSDKDLSKKAAAVENTSSQWEDDEDFYDSKIVKRALSQLMEKGRDQGFVNPSQCGESFWFQHLTKISLILLRMRFQTRVFHW